MELSPLFLIAGLILFGGCGVVALTDVLWRRIPNRVVFTLLAGSLLLVVDGRMPVPAFALSLGLSAAGLLFGTLLFSRGCIGGGDVKLICSLVLWFPPDASVRFICLTLVFGGVMAVATWGFRQALERGFMRIGIVQRRLLADQLCVPYGVSIAVAGITVFGDVWL